MTPSTSAAVKSSPRRVRKVSRVQRVGQTMVRAIAAIGLRELHFYVGVAMAAIGGAQLSVPLTLIGLGVVLALVGIRGIR